MENVMVLVHLKHHLQLITEIGNIIYNPDRVKRYLLMEPYIKDLTKMERDMGEAIWNSAIHLFIEESSKKVTYMEMVYINGMMVESLRESGLITFL